MKSNIVIVSLNYNLSKNVSLCLANKLDMYFLDVKDLIEYSLIDTRRVELLCGEKYLKKQEKNVIMGVACYENTIINFPYEQLLDEDYYRAIGKSSTIIYLGASKELLLQQSLKKKAQENLSMELIAFEELDNLLTQKSDITIKIVNNRKDVIIKQIITQLKNRG